MVTFHCIKRASIVHWMTHLSIVRHFDKIEGFINWQYEEFIEFYLTFKALMLLLSANCLV